MSARHYTYRAEWSAEDDEYVGLVAEFPSLSWLAPSAGEAIAGIEQLVGEVIADMTATREPIPEPLADRRYSGKIALRTTPEQHRRLTIEAAEQGVSLNLWVSQKLAAVPSSAPVAYPERLRSVLADKIGHLVDSGADTAYFLDHVGFVRTWEKGVHEAAGHDFEPDKLIQRGAAYIKTFPGGRKLMLVAPNGEMQDVELHVDVAAEARETADLE